MSKLRFTAKFKRWMLVSLSLLVTGGAVAQSANNVGTRASENLIKGVEDLPGIDPTDKTYWETNTDKAGYNDNAPEKTMFLYNVGTKKFLNMGGAYGTHAAMHTTPKYFFLFNNVQGEDTTNPNKLNLRTKQSTQKSTSDEDPMQSTDYMQYIVENGAFYNHVAGVYLDRRYNNVKGGSGTKEDVAGSNGWSFEKGSDYSTSNRTYRIYQMVGGQKFYLVAKAPDRYGGDAEAIPNTSGTYDVWKIIPRSQYNELFNAAPADLTEPTDATFLLKDPDFSVNNRYISSWHATQGTSFKLGTEYYYKTALTTGNYNYNKNLNADNYQLNYGRLFNASISGTNGEFWQGVAVTKPGWFVFRCRGLSNTSAFLYAEQCTDGTYGTPVDNEYSSQTLNTNAPTVFAAKDKMLQAGKEFSAGMYENEVMLYIQPKDNVSTYYIRFGIKVGGTASAKSYAAAPPSTDYLTIFDTFRMLYAGVSEEPELVLDEENTDLKYITEPADVYTNTNLHLKRAFSLNKWNTIMLPVSLTYGQMKTTFGNDVKLAYLWKLTGNTIRFLTVEPKSDDDVMLEADKPYIIYPTKSPGSSQAYTATLHKVEKTASTPAVAWTGTYQGNAVSNGKISIAANHYQIAKVTLDKQGITNLSSTWVPANTFTASLNGNTLTSYGTLAKTYDDQSKSIISERPTCENAYIMKGGKLYLVPNGKQYGLKAFRCWFTYSAASTSAKPESWLFAIDGVSDNTTDIEDILEDYPARRASRTPGVYSLSGQRIRENSDVSGLPAGLYIVDGRKYIVK